MPLLSSSPPHYLPLTLSPFTPSHFNTPLTPFTPSHFHTPLTLHIHSLSLSPSLPLSASPLPLPPSLLLCLLHSCLPHFNQPLTDEHVSYILRLSTDIHPHRPVLPPSTGWFVLDREENFFPHQLLSEKLPCLPCIWLK